MDPEPSSEKEAPELRDYAVSVRHTGGLLNAEFSDRLPLPLRQAAVLNIG